MADVSYEENNKSDSPNEEAKETTDQSDAGSLLYWKNWLKASWRAAKNSVDATTEAYKEYVSSSAEEPTLKMPQNQKPDNRFPIFWSSVRTIQPALYSRTPVGVAQPMLDTDADPFADLVCESVERLDKYLTHKFSFDRTMYSTRDDFIMGGKATNRVYYAAEINTEESQVRVFPQYAPEQPQQSAPQDPNNPQPQPQQQAPQQPQQPQIIGWTDDMGMPMQFDGEPEQDENGYFVTKVEESLDDECLELIPVSYKDIRHTPYARHWEEITDIAFRSTLTKEQVEDRFGEEIANALQYADKKKTDDTEQSSSDDTENPEKFVDVWELWCKDEEKVYWIVENYDDFLDQKDDPYELPGFFPCPPFILGTIGPDSMYPTPDYIQLRPFIMQLHALASRFRTLVRSNKVRGVFDNSVTELQDLAGSTPMDGDYIGINNFQGQIIGKGGLDQVIQHFPSEELTSATQQMQQIIAAYQETFNEMYGIPDIVRGSSDPSETAAAQQMKGKWMSLRFSSIQREFQRLVRDGKELLLDMAVLKFHEDKLFEIMGFPARTQEEQAQFPQVMALLKDFSNRQVRIDIETDSTISFNEDADVASRLELSSNITQGILQVNQAANGNSDILLLGYSALLFVVRGMKNGKMLVDDFTQIINKLKNPPPPPPPPVDPKIQIAQMKAQSDQQLEAMKQQHDGQLQQMSQAHEAQIEQMKQQGEERLAQIETGSKAQLEQFKGQVKQGSDQQKFQQDAQIEQLQARMDAAVETNKQQLEREKAMFEAQMKMQEQKFEMMIESERARAEVLKTQIESMVQIHQVQQQGKIAEIKASTL